MAEQSRLEIVVDSRQSEGKVRRVSDELDRLERVGVSAQRSARNTATGFGAIARQAQFAVPPVTQLTSLFGSLAGILGAREVIRYADAWENAGNQLRQVTRSTEELERIQSSLMGVANETRSAFEPTANLYSRLARATTEMGLSQQELIGLTRTINQSFAVSGATAAEAGAAITQLSQGLAAGALRGDEFNSVSEQAPGIMRAIAESLDMTIGDLRAFAAEGGITAEIVVEALQGASDTIESQFSRAVETFGQKITIARNNMLQFVGASDSVDGALDNLGDAAITLSESLDRVAQAGTVVAGVVAGRLVGRLITLSAGLTTAAGAAAGLRTALAFLGGPAGIAVAAAAGLFAFREELGLIPDPAGKARESLDLLNDSIEDTGEAAATVALVEMNAKLFDLERQASDARAELEALNNESGGAGVLGFSSGVVEQRARAEANVGSIEGQIGVVEQRMERMREILDGTAQSGDNTSDALDRLGQAADDVVAKFQPMLNQDVEELLDRVGPGATIDAQGQVRDMFGNALPTFQRELEGILQDQFNAFESDRPAWNRSANRSPAASSRRCATPRSSPLASRIAPRAAPGRPTSAASRFAWRRTAAPPRATCRAIPSSSDAWPMRSAAWRLLSSGFLEAGSLHAGHGRRERHAHRPVEKVHSLIHGGLHLGSVVAGNDLEQPALCNASLTRLLHQHRVLGE